MKRILALIVTACILATPTTAMAAPSLEVNNKFTGFFNLQVTEPELSNFFLANTKQTPEKPPAKPKPVVYTVVSGDNLTKIGTKHKVEWQRLWAKNKQLTHPDQLDIGDKITIPLPDEKLERKIPPSVSLPTATPGVETSTRPTKPIKPATASHSAGNTYSYGYCTWYVKNKRGASLPNGLGNANTWYSRASSMGMSVGSTPRAGAVGTTTRGSLGHVVYVESVNKDGSINISEMNAPTWGAVTYRTASASEFVYIY